VSSSELEMTESAPAKLPIIRALDERFRLRITIKRLLRLHEIDCDMRNFEAFDGNYILHGPTTVADDNATKHTSQ
jgi:hypothetical protein